MTTATPEPRRWPLTDEQRRALRRDFIDSINADAVCNLASRCNDSKPCRLFRDPASGSFNVCFFVEFHDGTKWVVRIPLVPMVASPWQKIQSEVATLKYLRKRTKIPVPHVHAHGPGGQPDEQNPVGQPFIILDYVGDKSLDLLRFVKAPVERRKHFYTQLVEILVELRQQEFAYVGSLVPDHDGGDEPVVGPWSSIELNELQINKCDGPAPPARFSSTIDFVFHQWHLTAKACDEPVSEQSMETVRLEVYGVEDLKGRIFDFVDPTLNHGPFVLRHADLRWPNIMVDDEWNITAVIDWEFSGTVPRQFFMPPTWLSGTDAGDVSGYKYRGEYKIFYEVLAAKAATSRSHRILADEWGPDLPRCLDMSMTVALLSSRHFVHAYYLGIYPRFHRTSRRELVSRTFDEDGPDGRLYKLAQSRFTMCREYDQYLKDNGLFIHDEEIDKAAERYRIYTENWNGDQIAKEAQQLLDRGKVLHLRTQDLLADRSRGTPVLSEEHQG